MLGGGEGEGLVCVRPRLHRWQWLVPRGTWIIFWWGVKMARFIAEAARGCLRGAVEEWEQGTRLADGWGRLGCHTRRR